MKPSIIQGVIFGGLGGVVLSTVILALIPALMPYSFLVGFGSGMVCTQAYLMLTNE